MTDAHYTSAALTEEIVRLRAENRELVRICKRVAKLLSPDGEIGEVPPFVAEVAISKLKAVVAKAEDTK